MTRSSDIEGLRTRIYELKAEIHQLEEEQPLQQSEALARLDNWLDLCTKPDAGLNLFEIDVQAFTHPNATQPGIPYPGVAIPLLFTMLRKDIREHFRKRIEAQCGKNPEGAIDMATRNKKVQQLREELFAIECSEERMILDAARDGMTIHRRPDVNPKVLVSVV